MGESLASGPSCPQFFPKQVNARPSHKNAKGRTSHGDQRIQFLEVAAVFLAERHNTGIAWAEIIEDALTDVAIAGASGENKEVATVAFARRIGESYSDEPMP